MNKCDRGIYVGVNSKRMIFLKNYFKLKANSIIVGTPGAGMNYNIIKNTTIVEPHGEIANTSLQSLLSDCKPD